MFIINPALTDQINTNQTQLTQSSFTPQEINDIRNISSSIKKIHQQRSNGCITNLVSQILTQQTSPSYNNHALINPEFSPQAISTPQLQQHQNNTRSRKHHPNTKVAKRHQRIPS